MFSAFDPKRRLRWFSGAALLCSAGLVFAATSLRPLWYLPDPAEADERSLLYWLALRDLEDYPRELQVALVNRLQSDIDPRELASYSSSGSKRMQRYSEQIHENAELLQHVWFETRCQEYVQKKDEQRYAFLADQLNAVFAWSKVLSRSADASQQVTADRQSSTNTASQLLGKIDDWMASAAQEDQPQMKRTVHDAAVCWLSSADLEAYSPAARRFVAQRISAELGERQPSGARPLPLSTTQLERLQQNAFVLVEAWANWQAELYAELAAEKRQAMVDACLDQVQSWRLDQLLSGGEAPQSTGLWNQLVAKLPEWLQHGEPAQRQRLKMFVAHLQQRFFWRSLQRLPQALQGKPADYSAAD